MKYTRAIQDSEIVFETISHGSDLHISITGGHRPHIGAVAIAQSRPSLTDEGKISASSSVITVCGHKEDQIAKNVSEEIAKHINGIVTVSCGIHFDDISTATIIEIRKIISELLNKLIQDLS